MCSGIFDITYLDSLFQYKLKWSIEEKRINLIRLLWNIFALPVWVRERWHFCWSLKGLNIWRPAESEQIDWLKLIHGNLEWMDLFDFWVSAGENRPQFSFGIRLRRQRYFACRIQRIYTVCLLILRN